MTGGTGLVGRAMVRELVSKGYQVIILTRTLGKQLASEHTSYAKWDIDKQEIDIQAVQLADFIIHLAGAGVMEKKWTNAYKKEIRESRTRSSKLLIDTLKNHSHAVKAVISASAIGWYGADPIPKSGVIQEGFTEDTIADEGFLGETCRLWEESMEPVRALGIRLVRFRIGIVLSKDGGALAEFRRPLKLGIAGILGNGKQMISWIHITDLCRLFIYAIENDAVTGTFNAVAPVPVDNKTMTLKLAGALRGKFFIAVHVPLFLIKLLLGQRSIEVLKSTRVSCAKIRKEGFIYIHPSIDAVMANLFHP